MTDVLATPPVSTLAVPTLLTPQALAIFSSIESDLKKIAHRYKVSDPISQTNSWFARCEEILRGFDEGRFDRLIRVEGELQALPKNPSAELQAEFQKSLRRYLVQSFRNELKTTTKKERRFASTIDGYGDRLLGKYDSIESAYVAALDSIRLSAFVDLIKEDVSKLARRISTVKQRVSYLVLESLCSYYEDLLSSVGNVPVVRNYDGENVAEFFSAIVRGKKTPEIQASLIKLAKKEENVLVRASALLLAAADPAYALEQQIARYLQKVPERLRKRHSSSKGTQ